MNDTIIYHPNKEFKFMVPILFGFSQICFVLALWAISQQALPEILFFAIAYVLFLFSTKPFYSMVNVVYYFESTGIRVAGGKHTNYRFVLWQDFSHAYYVRNFKNQTSLVLSPTALDKKQAKKFMNKIDFSGKSFFDGVLIVPMGFEGDTEIKSRIDELFPDNYDFGR